MAVGDAAGAAGFKVYDGSLLVADLDDALNQRGDEMAGLDKRLDVAEEYVGTPKFVVARGNGFRLPAEEWTPVPAGAWATPAKRTGGFAWSGGVLTIPRPGMYQVSGHFMGRLNDFRTVAIQITRNTSNVDSAATICAGEITVQSPEKGTNGNMSADCARVVSLNANDKLYVNLLQRNRGAETIDVGRHPFDLTFDCIYLDKQ